jgi:hypothetical protein
MLTSITTRWHERTQMAKLLIGCDIFFKESTTRPSMGILRRMTRLNRGLLMTAPSCWSKKGKLMEIFIIAAPLTSRGDVSISTISLTGRFFSMPNHSEGLPLVSLTLTSRIKPGNCLRLEGRTHRGIHLAVRQGRQLEAERVWTHYQRKSVKQRRSSTKRRLNEQQA